MNIFDINQGRYYLSNVYKRTDKFLWDPASLF